MELLGRLWSPITKSHERRLERVNSTMVRSWQSLENSIATAENSIVTAENSIATVENSIATAHLGCVNLNDGRRPSYLTRMWQFDYDMLADATGDFSSSRQLNKLCRGTGKMFKGRLLSDEALDTRVVVKMFHHRFTDDTSTEVHADLKAHVLRHRYLLSPLGYSLRKGKLYVVYKYMEKGSLDHHLNTNQGLSWEQLLRIIIGVAMGLEFLHQHNAIHGAVKVSNILLDKDMTTARLGDFGYARAVSSSGLNVIDKMKLFFQRNTGLASECIPTYEMDVFDFGVVILQIVCGILDSQLLVEKVSEYHHEGNILGAVHAKLAAAVDFKEDRARRLLRLGLLACCHPEPKQRPRMGHVVKMLTGRAPVPSEPLKTPTCEDPVFG